MSSFIQYIPEYLNKRSLSFDGLTQYINKGQPPELDLSGNEEFTVSVFFKTDNNSQNTLFVSKGDSNFSNRSYSIGINSLELLSINIGGNLISPGGFPFLVSEWNHLLVTIEDISSVKYVMTYLNTALIDTDTASSSTIAVDVLIGAVWNTFDTILQGLYEGLIAEPTFFTGPFDQDEVDEFVNGHEYLDVRQHSRSSDLLSWTSFGDITDFQNIPDRAGLPNATSVDLDSNDISLEFPNVVNSSLGLLLDKVDGAYAHWGTRRVTLDYSGPLIRVRRDSDGMETDIYTDAGDELDLVALATFLNGANGFVSCFYDLTGNGHTICQGILNSQGQIIIAGSNNGKPIINLDGTDDYYTSAEAAITYDFLSDGSDNAMSIYCKITSTGSDYMPFAQNELNGHGFGYGRTVNDTVIHVVRNASNTKVLDSITPNDSFPSLVYNNCSIVYKNTFSTHKLRHYTNQHFQEGDDPATTFSPGAPQDQLYVFSRPTQINRFLQAEFCEFTLWNRFVDYHEIAAIRQDRLNYYG